jgi:DNA polymerase-1
METEPETGSHPIRTFQRAPGFVEPVRKALERPAVPPSASLAIPRCPLYYRQETNLVEDGESANRMLDFARQRPLSHIGIDTEFTYDRPGVMIDRRNTAYDPRSVRPLLLSLALVEPKVNGGSLYRFVIDVRRTAVMPSLRSLLQMPILFVGHFLRAELHCLWQLGLPEPSKVWDTWVHEKAVHLGVHHKKYAVSPATDEAAAIQAREQAEEDEEFSLSLVATCRRHAVDVAFGDKERLQQSFLDHGPNDSFSDEQIEYSSTDAEAAARLYLPQVIEAAQAGLLHHLVEIEMPWVVTTARMGWNGVRVDLDLCQAVTAAGDRHLAVLQPKLADFGIENVKSFPQLKAFFGRQGLLELFQRNDKTTFDKEQLEAVADRHPAIPLIRAARRILDVRKEKILTGELIGADGRVHPDYRQLGTATGRQSSRWPNVMGLGRMFRPLVVPESDKGIGEADWCQIEVGVAASVYGDEKLVELFNTDDVYSAMAKHVFVDELCLEDLELPGQAFKSKHRGMRDRMKICTLGIIYGLTPHGLALRLNVPEPEAAALQQRFMAMFPALSRGLTESWTYGGMRGHVSTHSGLRRHRAYGGHPSSWERNWMTNHPVQGSAADVFKAAGNRLDKLYPKYDAKLIVPMHDAFVFEAPLDVLGEVTTLTERVMVETVQEFFPALRPKVEVNVRQPQCWNKDGHADSIHQWMDDPMYTF